MTVSRTSGSAEAPATRRTGWILGLLAFAQLIIAVDYNIVFVALPEIGAGLGFSAQTLQWVVSAYAVTFGGFLLLGGRGADLFGRRRMFVAGLALYGASSLLGGLAATPLLLVAARAVQGIGGAFLAPATLSLVTTTFAEGRERNRALAIWGGAGGSGMVLGSLFGGLLTESFGWSAVFFFNVPLVAVAVALALRFIPPDAGARSARGFDLAGALTATAGATLLVFALVQGPAGGWGSAPVLIALIAAVVLLSAFGVIEARGADPLMPLRLFANRGMSTGMVVTFLFMATFGAVAYFFTVYFQGMLGYSALQTGVAFLLPCASVLAGTVLGGRLATRFGVRATLLGALVLGVVGTVAFGVAVSPDGSYLGLVPGLVVLSLGQGIVFTAMFAAATSGVAAADQGIASGIVTTGQQIGGAVGLAVLVALANSADGPADPGGLRTAFYAVAAGIALTFVVTLNFRRARPE